MSPHTESPNTNVTLKSDILNIQPDQPLSIEKYLDSLDNVHDETALIRNQMISQISNVVATIQFDVNNEKLDDVDKKLHVFDMLHKLVESKEKSITNRANMRMKNKMAESVDDLGKIAADLLTKIDLSVNGKTKNCPIPEDNLKELENVVGSLDIDIPSSELRDDPYDMS